MKYNASIKSYNPDDEDSEEFNSWEEAAAWLADQRKYHRGSGNMQVNGQRVRFHGGVLVNDELEPATKTPSNFESIMCDMSRASADFDRIFRPQSVRPTNVATHRHLGTLGTTEE